MKPNATITSQKVAWRGNDGEETIRFRYCIIQFHISDRDYYSSWSFRGGVKARLALPQPVTVQTDFGTN